MSNPFVGLFVALLAATYYMMIYIAYQAAKEASIKLMRRVRHN